MAEHSSIEWTDATWNPITGCSVVSPGCTNCYAMRLAGTRLQHHPSRAGLTHETKAGPVWSGTVRLNEQWLTQPLEWRRPRKIFVCAHGDLFAQGVPDARIDRVFAVMASAPQHTFQALTKRSARMRAYVGDVATRDRVDRIMDDLAPAHWCGREVEDYGGWPLPNVWLGVSTEDQRRADERIPDLLATPAAVRFVSVEPLLGPVDLGKVPAEGSLGPEPAIGLLDWIIAGGESGPGARPMHPDWARSLRDQCATAGVPFHFKQWGAWISALDRDRHDPDWRADYSDSLNNRRSDIAWLNLAGGSGFHGEGFNVMRRVGKAAAGRLLDGRTHDDMPTGASILPSTPSLELA